MKCLDCKERLDFASGIHYTSFDYGSIPPARCDLCYLADCEAVMAQGLQRLRAMRVEKQIERRRDA